MGVSKWSMVALVCDDLYPLVSSEQQPETELQGQSCPVDGVSTMS